MVILAARNCVVMNKSENPVTEERREWGIGGQPHHLFMGFVFAELV